MEMLIPVVLILAILAFALGTARDKSLARKIGGEVNAQTPPEDPVVLMEKLHQLHKAGALTDAEYEAQKARILNEPRG
ncbi:hypothetical protein Rhe02_18070 [Rhizocola hellebori]|uniref:SHOCT domain-containing protein n=1 Tax=Rhizocola hellebori TaxID=1392758 RepID=A0A8J3Q5V1_9ACTN|nr:SHOCT domain-containing protein [Rhizocola hellebori]GIH03740.1 hypothetical protein Rhe02_18070 [Rhizocola hellebori]